VDLVGSSLSNGLGTDGVVRLNCCAILNDDLRERASLQVLLGDDASPGRGRVSFFCGVRRATDPHAASEERDNSTGALTPEAEADKPLRAAA
jgi:hypothetical protein